MMADYITHTYFSGNFV